MLSNLIITVIDTENSKFETDVRMTNEEFEYLREQAMIEKNNINKGLINASLKNEHINDTTKYVDYKCECLFLNAKKQEINEEYFEKLLENQEMFLLLLNINPNDIHNNAEEELRFWADDSNKILLDKTLDDRTKLKVLPIKTFGIELKGVDYKLVNCKLIENRSDKKFPFYYIIMVEKIKL
jgi:hypothetical protein